MRRIMEKLEQRGNKGLIETFLEVKGKRDGYEVWKPYFNKGMAGFIDLVVEDKNRISLYKFERDASSIGKIVKQLKLETRFFKKSKESSIQKINSFLVFSDTEKNRKNVLTDKKLLDNQPFEILILNEGTGRIESLLELEYSIPRLFKSEGLELEDDALDYLLVKPDHDKIEDKVLDSKDHPEKITREYLEGFDIYFENGSNFKPRKKGIQRSGAVQRG